MDFQEIALRMFPMWLFGLGMMLCAIKAGYKKLLRIEGKAVLNFLKIMSVITVVRALMFSVFPEFSHSLLGEARSVVDIIPWQTTLFVFWEDAVHTLPLIILFGFLNDKWYSKVLRYALILVAMFVFGMGHTYQGYIAAMILSLYIPYTIKLGDKYGVGTVMLCHTLYDLITILTLKALV